jgi:hypothetical protein
MTSCPRRGCTAALDEIVNGIVASPCPDFAAVNAIQSTSVLTVHEHSRFVPMRKFPVAPGAFAARGSAVTLSAHRESVDGAVTLVEDDDPHAATASTHPQPTMKRNSRHMTIYGMIKKSSQVFARQSPRTDVAMQLLHLGLRD